MRRANGPAGGEGAHEGRAMGLQFGECGVFPRSILTRLRQSRRVKSIRIARSAARMLRRWFDCTIWRAARSTRLKTRAWQSVRKLDPHRPRSERNARREPGGARRRLDANRAVDD
jgi:hypothetical protein